VNLDDVLTAVSKLEYECEWAEGRYRIINPGENDCVWMDVEDGLVNRFTRYAGNNGITIFRLAVHLLFRILDEYTIQDSEEFHRMLDNRSTNEQDENAHTYDLEKIWEESKFGQIWDQEHG
jgi:hypothetical protein